MALYEGFIAALTDLASGDNDDAAVAAAAATFVEEHHDDFVKALERFGADGRLLGDESMPASAFNDFYKWTMLPVMSAAERARPQGVVCTFSANIRDDESRGLLLKSASGEDSPELYNELKEALQQLANRKFDRLTFERVARDYALPGWSTHVFDYVCGPPGKTRTLASSVRVPDVGSTDGAPELPENPHAVEIQVFTAACHKLHGSRRIYVEATGPWRRVTWLETTLMQAVYEVLFRHRMRKRYGASGLVSDASWYPKWLATAFVRCVRSSAAAKASGLKGVLMTGRRTGGMPLMLCQNIYISNDFICEDGSPGLLGTSSVTAHYWLRDSGVNPASVPRPAGTHAHELSMVIGALLGDVDDEAGLPLSQIVGHTLYFFLSVPQGDVKDPSRLRLMPMLPDTLGTKAFMTTATQLHIPAGVHEGQPFLSVVGSARQDSGAIPAFKTLMDQYDFKGTLMASEVETPNDLIAARDAGYTLFGAGGFFGDSEKAWDKAASNLSMAIKVLRVHVGKSRTAFDPVKTGDTSGGSGEGKLEADGTLDLERLQQLKDRTRGFVEARKGAERETLQALYEAALKEFAPDIATEGSLGSRSWGQWWVAHLGSCCLPARG